MVVSAAILVGAVVVVGGASGAYVAAAPPVSEGIHRLVTRVSFQPDEECRLHAENPSASPLVSTAPAELVLTPEPRTETREPYAPTLSYHAPLDLSGDAAVSASNGSTLTIAASSSKAWSVRLSKLPWHKKESAVRFGSHPFRQVVPAGRYKLSFWVGGWRSNEVDVMVHRGGRVTLVDESAPTAR